MSRTTALADAHSHGIVEHHGPWEPESPFVDRLVVGEAPGRHRAAPPTSPLAMESPFLSLYETGAGTDYPSTQARELYGILAELRDAEFDGAVYQLQAEAYDLLAPRLEGEENLSEYEVEQFFSAHFGPLVRETGRMLDGMAAEVERRNLDGMTESEIDGLLDGFAPEDTGLTPSFEGFLKKVFDKAKTAVKKAASAVKKGVVKAVKTVGKIATAPIAIVLKKLKALVKPLLEKVLKSAIGKLPEPLQDAATQAAAKLFGDKAKTSDVESELADREAASASPDSLGTDSTDDEIHYLQTEFDLQIANLVLADDETRQDLALADYETRARRTGTAPYRRLRRARRRFAGQVRTLGDGDDPAPAVEEFIPAILPVLKVGLKLIGRKRVVDAIGKLVGNLLRPFTGPKMTAPLANAIVDTGLKVIGFEMNEDHRAALAAEATASVVEDTVRQVANMPAEVLENEVVLEAVVEEAFDRALARNFPPMPRRPDLLRSELPGSWSQVGEYKRFSPATPIQVTISQRMANDLKTFGGGTPTVLGHNLKDLVGKRATVWLYEAVSGTWLSKISRDEKGPHGLGGIEEVKWMSIHPLTPDAAVLLTDDATMAGTKQIDPRYLASPHTITPGQRFYYLEIPGLEPRTSIGHDSAFRYVLDCSQRKVSAAFYLSEQDAQGIAKHLRIGNKTKASQELVKILPGVAMRAINGNLRDTVDIRKEAIALEHFAPAAAVAAVVFRGLMWLLKRVGPPIANWLLNKLLEELFVKAVDDPQDGVTFTLLWRDPAGLDLLCRLLNSENVPIKEFDNEFMKFVANLLNNIPQPTITPGHHL